MTHRSALFFLALAVSGCSTEADGDPTFTNPDTEVDTSQAADATPEVSADTAPDPAGSLRFDQIQTLGTHNSYHVLVGAPADPSHDYTHPPLPEQLDAGVRHFELDVHRAPDGGPHRVYHIVGIDPGTSCELLSDCLTQIRDWSLTNPAHHLLVVLIEPKDDIARLFADIGQDPRESGEDLWSGHIATLDLVITSVFEPGHLLTPLSFRARGTSPTIRHSLENRGFPTIAETRGKIAFVLNDTSEQRAEYRAAGEGLMFVFGEVGDDDAAFVKADDPRSNPARVRDAVTRGYVVRTRADADLEIDTDRREAALSSGAQLVTTDYPRQSPPESGYGVWLDGGAPSRCNPVSAPDGCDASVIEPR